MRQKIIVFALFAIVCGVIHAQQDKDTISYPDWRYYHPQLDTSDTLFIVPDQAANYYAAYGYLGYIQYEAIQPLRIYGIAVTSQYEGPLFLRTFYNYPQYSPDPPNVDSSKLDLYAVLVQKEGPDSCARHVDSVKWHPRPPDRYYHYEAQHQTNAVDTTAHPPFFDAPVYEFYFDTPLVVMDTFYVGFRSDYVKSPVFDSLLNILGLGSVGWDRHYPQQWAWSVIQLHNPSASNIRNILFEGGRWRPDLMSNCFDVPNNGWGGIFPIIVPPDTDAVAGIPVRGFHRGENYEGWPVFEWLQTEGQELYEVAYGRADQPPASYMVVGTTNPWLILRDSTLDSTVVYAAQCRSRHHHACALHDTLVWSAWTDTVEFYTGRYRPGSAPTEGIAEAGDRASFTLSPNPATGSVHCVWEGETFPGGVLTMTDAAGREVLRRELAPQTRDFTFSVAELPAGTYFVTLATAEGSSTKKLVIK
jgi:hypothetical protein